MEDDDLLRRRTWRWLQGKIAGLLERPPVIAPDGQFVPSTRLGFELNPPKTNEQR